MKSKSSKINCLFEKLNMQRVKQILCQETKIWLLTAFAPRIFICRLNWPFDHWKSLADHTGKMITRWCIHWMYPFHFACIFFFYLSFLLFCVHVVFFFLSFVTFFDELYWLRVPCVRWNEKKGIKIPSVFFFYSFENVFEIGRFFSLCFESVKQTGVQMHRYYIKPLCNWIINFEIKNKRSKRVKEMNKCNKLEMQKKENKESIRWNVVLFF